MSVKSAAPQRPLASANGRTAREFVAANGIPTGAAEVQALDVYDGIQINNA